MLNSSIIFASLTVLVLETKMPSFRFFIIGVLPTSLFAMISFLSLIYKDLFFTFDLFRTIVVGSSFLGITFFLLAIYIAMDEIAKKYLTKE